MLFNRKYTEGTPKMDKQNDPPSYDVAVSNPPIGFVSSQPMPMPMPHQSVFPEGATKAAPYPTVGGPSSLSDYISSHPQSVTQVVIHQAVNYGDKSQPVTCPHCAHDIVTRTEAEPSTQTHLCALLMCAFGIWPCCCIPYFVDSCQKINHYCPNCGTYLGSYQN